MATYTPSQLKATAYMSNAAADLVKPASAHTSVVRNFIVQANTASKTFTLDMATSTADAAGTRFFDAYPLTANIPFIFGGWLVCDTTTWMVGLASAANAVTFSASGYDYA